MGLNYPKNWDSGASKQFLWTQKVLPFLYPCKPHWQVLKRATVTRTSWCLSRLSMSSWDSSRNCFSNLRGLNDLVANQPPWTINRNTMGFLNHISPCRDLARKNIVTASGDGISLPGPNIWPISDAMCFEKATHSFIPQSLQVESLSPCLLSHKLSVHKNGWWNHRFFRSKNLWNGTLVKKKMKCGKAVNWTDFLTKQSVCLERFGSVEAMTLAEGAYTSFQILHRHASGHLGLIQMLGLLGSLKLGGWTWLDLASPWYTNDRDSKSHKPTASDSAWAQCLCTSCMVSKNQSIEFRVAMKSQSAKSLGPPLGRKHQDTPKASWRHCVAGTHLQ